MIIDKIIKFVNKIINFVKRFIKTKSGRIILLLLIVGDLACYYWVNIVKKEYYYPGNYEHAISVTFFLILGIIGFLSLLIAGFIKPSNHKEPGK